MTQKPPFLRYLVLLAVLLAVVLAYANSFENGFHFDDFHTVTENPAVRSLRNVPRFFTDTTAFSVLPANQTYRPVVSTSLAVDYALGHGYVPFWFHLSTMVMFLLLVWLLARFYEGIFTSAPQGPKPRSSRRLIARAEAPASLEANAPAYLGLIGAAWFGLHPAMAETVNYVIQRGDLYCTLGCVAALVMYVRAPKLRRWGLYLLPVVSAMLSKPPAAVFPVLLLGYVWFFVADGPAGRRWRISAVAAMPSVVVVAGMLWLQSAMTPKTFAPSILSPGDYRLVQPYVWLRYFGSLFLPLHLNVDSDLGPIGDVFDPRVLAGLLFLLLLVAAIAYAVRRQSLYPIAYGLLWFVVTELPTSLYPLSEVENDHRMFFSFVGLIAAVVWVAWLLVQRLQAGIMRAAWFKPAGGVLVVMALSGYAYGVHTRNRVWLNDETLWQDDVQKSPHNGRGLMNYGLTQMAKGAYPQALDLFTRALEFTPNYPSLEINLGIVNGGMADQGDPSRAAEAERHFLRAISLAPNDDQPHAYYGRWLKNHGRLTESIEQLKMAIELNPQRMLQRDELADALSRSAAAGTPQNAAGWIAISVAQYNQTQYAQAIASAQRALLLDPKSAVAYNNIGASYAGMQQWDEAIRNEQEAVKLDPALQIARNNLQLYTQSRGQGTQGTAPESVAALLSQSAQLSQAGRYDDSIAAARRALLLDPQSAVAWNNIAAGYESMHRWDDAIAAAQKAIALKPDFQLAKNNLAWSISQKKLGAQ